MQIQKLTSKLKQSSSPLPDTLLISAIAKYDNIPQLVRTPVNESSYIHSSSLSSFCARRAAILLEAGSKPTESVSGADKIVWAMGRAVESHIRDALLYGIGKERFFGKWSCKCGHTTGEGSYDSSLSCNRCKSKVSNYHEYTILDEELQISGNPDMILIGDDGCLIPIEIKSIKKGTEADKGDSFMSLSAPISSHVKQVCRYAYLLKRKGFKVSDYGKVIYACKEYMFKNPYKEFTVNTTSTANLASFNEEVEQVIKFNTFKSSGKLPEREFCSSLFSKMAKECPACNTCFKE